MAIEKLTEFAKTGQKNTDNLDLETGFIVNRKPARQWFNWLFNTLTTKINEIIDADFMPKSDVVDNLTTNDATKPVSAKQAKLLQDNKLDKNANAVSATKLQTARTINGVAFDGTTNINLPTASTSTSGTVQLNNTLTSSSTAQALTAAQGKKLQDEKLDKSGGTVTGTLEVNGPLRSRQYIDLGYGESSDANRAIVFYSAGTSKKGQIASTTSGAMEFTGAASYNFDKTVSANISGNAATATKLQTARTIAISGAVTGTATGFDGSANIAIATTAIDGSKITTGTIPAARIPTLNQSTTGNAATATKLKTARTINGVSFDGTANITIPTLGNGQTWVDVTTSRVVGTTYTNSTGKPIMVSIVTSAQAGEDTHYLYVGNVIVSGYLDQESNDHTPFSAIVPNGSTYRLTINVGKLIRWVELR